MQPEFGGQQLLDAGDRRDLRQERFQEYFPRLFAFACSATGDEEAARDVTVCAFSNAFALPDLRKAEFELELFRAGRELCTGSQYRNRQDDGLNAREREVISLVFDAKFEPGRVAELLDMRAETVSVTLARGLRKLTTILAPRIFAAAAVPSCG